MFGQYEIYILPVNENYLIAGEKLLEPLAEFLLHSQPFG